MKAHFHMIPMMMQDSFTVKHEVQARFDNTWHYHPELELHYIIKGSGTRFIGNSIDSFSAGDLVLIGENVPHTWKCDDKYFEDDSSLMVEAIVIQFRKDFLGENFLNLPESHLIPQLFEKAKAGMDIHGIAKEKVIPLMQGALESNGLSRIIDILSILNILAENKDYTPITFPLNPQLDTDDYSQKRLNKVYHYTISNYKNEITLEDISTISNLSITSFCRYFKTMTKMTYYNFLTQIRISQACRLLIDDKFPTNVICYECGFNNISNFYRHFKRITGQTPKEYKQTYMSAIN